MPKKFKFVSSKPKARPRIFSLDRPESDTAFLNGTHIEILSNREITVDGCNGVFEYTESYIRLNLGKGSLILCGTDFDIVSFEGRLITVRGNLSTIEFS